ncbi:MAG: TlpA family protein disulfide reductase [Candidatus Sumerlaeaceae bacterium]
MRFFEQTRKLICLGAFFASLAEGLAVVSPHDVELGAPAAPLQNIDWVTTPPASLEWGKIGKIAIVEFWATWCGPCRISIPHLAELQRKYAAQGVTIVGISDEPKDTVQQFVATQGVSMPYAVGVQATRQLFRSYMGAFGVRGIPHAFIVSADGRILWHGHPMMMDKPLEDIISGRYDLEKARLADRAQRALSKLQHILTRGPASQREEALNAMAQLAEQFQRDPAYVSELAKILRATAVLNPGLSARYVDIARQIYRRNPRLVDVAEVYTELLRRDGRTTEADQMTRTVGEMRTKSLVRPVLPRPVARQETFMSQSR